MVASNSRARQGAGENQGEHFINALTNQWIPKDHQPVPSTRSPLNKIRTVGGGGKSGGRTSLPPTNWPKDVVYITQCLTSDSIPDAIAEGYVLPPQLPPVASRAAVPKNKYRSKEPITARMPEGEELSGKFEQIGLSSSSRSTTLRSSSVPSANSGHDILPVATHNGNVADPHLYLLDLSERIPLSIRSIDSDTPFASAGFHAQQANLSAHPSIGSYGLFLASSETIPPNTFIRSYLGVLHTKANADERSEYDLSLTHDPRLLALPPVDKSKDTETEARNGEQTASALYIDSRFWGNESRFVNDYRGIAQRPNVEFRSFKQCDYTMPTTTTTNNHYSEMSPDKNINANVKFAMGIWSIKPIRKGEELTINYGKNFWKHFDELHPKDITQDEKVEQEENHSSSSSSSLHAEAVIPPTPTGKAAKSTQLNVGNKSEDPIQAMLSRSRNRLTSNNRPAFKPSPSNHRASEATQSSSSPAPSSSTRT